MRDDEMLGGVVAAVLAKVDEALQPLRQLLPGSNPEERLSDCFIRLHHQQSLQELRAHRYKTNDIVEVGDDFIETLRQSKIGINGMSLDLEVREVLLLFVLARQVRSQASAGDRFHTPEARFLSVATLLDEIERLKAEAGLEGLWRHPIDTDVHKAVSGLRARLDRAGFNRNLIEGRRGSGYRLSTPHWNLILPGGAVQPRMDPARQPRNQSE